MTFSHQFELIAGQLKNLNLVIICLMLAACGGGSSDKSNISSAPASNVSNSSIKSLPAAPSIGIESSNSSFSSRVSSNLENSSISSQSFSLAASSEMTAINSSATSSSVVSSSVANTSSTNSSKSIATKSSSSLNNSLLPNEVQFTAWVGKKDSVVEIPAAQGLLFSRARNADCDFSNIINCLSGQANLVESSSILDESFNLQNSSYFVLSNSFQKVKKKVSFDRFSERFGFSSISFAGKLWVIGGYENSVGYLNDVWSSTDGVVWAKEIASAAFPARSYHQIVVFNNKLWLSGGSSKKGKLNDVWSSSDGVNWEKATSNAGFAAREEHAMAVFKNKLWVVGGYGDTEMNDVWSSDDGVVWIKRLESASFSARSGHQMTEFNGRLWVIGGQKSVYNNEIWSSLDGINWGRSSKVVPFSARSQHSLKVFGDSLILTSGYNISIGFLDDIWSSKDGETWDLIVDVVPFSVGAEKQLNVLNNKLYIIGGYNDNSVWSSVDALQWNEETVELKLPKTTSNIIYFKNMFWSLSNLNSIYSSSDGLNWKKNTISASIPARSYYSFITHNNRLWIIGGFISVGKYTNDVWSSDDGITWVKEIDHAAFSPRALQAAISFQDKIWVIGGAGGSQYSNEIWSSADGKIWVNVGESSLPSSGVLYQHLIEFNKKLFHFINSGNIFTGGRSLQVRTSSDGVNWTAESFNSDLTVPDDFTLQIFDNKLWLIDSSVNAHNIWSSVDGVHWIKEFDSVPFNVRQVFVFQNELFGTGNGYRVEGNSGITINQTWKSSDGKNWRRGYQDKFVLP